MAHDAVNNKNTLGTKFSDGKLDLNAFENCKSP